MAPGRSLGSSSLEAGSPIRRLLPRGIAAALAVLLSACGFHPMYGTAEGGIAPAELGSIKIAPIADRTGQILRNDLFDRLTPHGAPEQPRYVLEIKLSEGRRELAIRPDETATRAELIFTATYNLFTFDHSAVVASGTASSQVSYDILKQEYATVSAERDAREQAMRDLSERIRTRLSVALTRFAESSGS